MTLNELIAALERAEGPSDELDIACAPYAGWVFAKCIVSISVGTPRDAWVKTDGSGEWRFEPPSFTASIDAALTLVPEGYNALIYPTGAARVWPIKGRRVDDLSYGRSAALALCIAALKARAT